MLFNKRKMILTCPATAKPSASNEVANQTCKQIWKAAIDVDPSFAAIEAAIVTQKVAAITLNNSTRPGPMVHKKLKFVESYLSKNCEKKN